MSRCSDSDMKVAVLFLWWCFVLLRSDMATENTGFITVASWFKDLPVDEDVAAKVVPQLKSYLRAHGVRFEENGDQLLKR